MRLRCRALVVTMLVTALAAQEPRVERPIALIAEAETLLEKKEVEDAVLLLWRALDDLAGRPSNPVDGATAMSARFLLQQSDPNETARRRAFASVARRQVELATAYRLEKWLDVAAARLDVADRYDRDAGARERALLEEAKAQFEPAATRPEPPVAGSVLLRRADTIQISGEWREVDGELESAPHASGNAGGIFCEWVTTSSHESNEIVVEFKAATPEKDFNAGLWVGFVAGRTGDRGYRVVAQYRPEHRHMALAVWRIDGQEVEQVGESVWGPRRPAADGYHRLAVRVQANCMRAQLDDVATMAVSTPSPIRGRVGLLLGDATRTSCSMRFRNLRVGPLPADRAADEEVLTEADAATQNEIDRAVGEANERNAKGQPEAASLRLRAALGLADNLQSRMLRDNLRRSIERTLAQTDPIALRRKKAAQAIAGELGALADRYARAGMVRAAAVLADRAAVFDPGSQAARQAAMRARVAHWNVAQATARAAELRPPADDGTELREWFAEGRKLDPRGAAMVVAEPGARAEHLAPDTAIGWLPHPLARAITQAGVHVHLPAEGAQAGLYFDVVDSTTCGLVLISRHANGLRLHAFLEVANNWVRLAQRDIAMDSWRLDAWHAITVEANEAGLLARCYTAEIEVDRKVLGKATGSFGLYAGNAGVQPITVELRAFQIGQ